MNFALMFLLRQFSIKLQMGYSHLTECTFRNVKLFLLLTELSPTPFKFRKGFEIKHAVVFLFLNMGTHDNY